MSAREIVGPGTAEATWQGWAPLGALPALDLPDPPRVVVVAPHPDDEVLGPGGTLSLLSARGVAVEVLALTDGEASHPRAPVAPHALARQRVGESERALGLLLPREATVHRLRRADGSLSADEHRLAAVIAGHLRRRDWCLAPHRLDGHPDHEAAARAAVRACTASGARLLEYPVWLWHWSAPGDGAPDWERARRVDLPASVAASKRAAIAAFRSQIEPLAAGEGGEPILPEAVRARFERSYEVLFT